MSTLMTRRAALNGVKRALHRAMTAAAGHDSTDIQLRDLRACSPWPIVTSANRRDRVLSGIVDAGFVKGVTPLAALAALAAMPPLLRIHA